MTDEFIGLGEERVVEILKHLFPDAEILQQVPIKDLIPYEEWKKLGKEHSQHLHDIVLTTDQTYVIEVNLKHGGVAEAKWQNVYEPQLRKAGYSTVTIDDNECLSLFQLDGGIHNRVWQDYVDVIKILNKQGITET